MKIIPLTQGQYATIDDEDFDRINAHRWYAQWNPDTKSFYARRKMPRNNGKQLTAHMHRDIVLAPADMHVDHVNHNTLDNRKGNLRVCSISQNNANQKLLRRNTSGYKGVCWNRKLKKWQSQISNGHSMIYIGVYDSPVDAALAYDTKAICLFGEFALTNYKLGLLPCQP